MTRLKTKHLEPEACCGRCHDGYYDLMPEAAGWQRAPRKDTACEDAWITAGGCEVWQPIGIMLVIRAMCNCLRRFNDYPLIPGQEIAPEGLAGKA